MGERREGDARVHVIICLLILCILAGGAFLCLYIFLPATESSKWYYLAGIVLEAIPWAFWLFTYLYTCFKARGRGGGGAGGGISPKGGGAGAWKPPSTRTNSSAAGSAAAPTSPVKSPAGDDARHVHFGEVVVVGNDEDDGKNRLSGGDGSTGGGGGAGREHNNNGPSALNDAELSVCSRESEMPLKFGASSCK
ncbi:uncharacterized protein LOC116207847 [Punica granatum]|uniref:Uncharacterized protein n=2 Tax=Punica granatum TaxID=22663 RepID=A0A218XLW2_PUNGR|nr:uncharacterized protein LOC116207847 [Punica granatum]OWM85686.1 hypothetical protein CDL15_Pgr029109 [Punica granatum]PKI70128.1 hypothetical protein CRG98_009460 [Punica granatum]